jgi:uncharacterized protein
MNTTIQPIIGPVILFFTLSLVFLMVLALPGILGHYGVIVFTMNPLPLMIIGSWTPNIAAFLVVGWLLKERGGIRSMLLRWTMWRISPKWYFAAASPLFLTIALVPLWFLIIGEPLQNTGALNPGTIIGMLFISLITGAMGEELGWRGFALPRLQSRMSALTASVVVGTVWGIWHLPLWFTGMGYESTPFLLFLYSCIVMSVIITWICNNTRGSMVLVTLFHMLFNVGLGITATAWDVPLETSLTIVAVAFTIMAGVVLIHSGATRLTRKAMPIDPEKGVWTNARD